jgi:hypothetical protein
MLITVTTSSQTLDDILTDVQKEQIADNRNAGFRQSYQVQVLGATNVYVEVGATATVAGSFKIIQNGTLAFDTKATLENIHLIAETSSNTDVRVISS